MNQTATAPVFLDEAAAYTLLIHAGLVPPRHGWLGGNPPFKPGEPVVLKGLGRDVWHKSELGCVEFLSYEPAALAETVRGMRTRVEAAGREWIGALVCERIAGVAAGQMPTEGFFALRRDAAGWILLAGFGGMAADALAELAPPLRWPVAYVTPDIAAAEFAGHLLGRTWLGRLRGTKGVTTTDDLTAFFTGLWRAVAMLEAEQATLLELNPVVVDGAGRLRPLDAVGRRDPPPTVCQPPPGGFLSALRAPARIALAGVSARPGGIGNTILENLRRADLPVESLLILKPGHKTWLGLACAPDVASLRRAPVDLLILALPAATSVELLEALISQGGGARCVALVAGGIGDGADREGLGVKIRALLDETRTRGAWTPAVIGPNFVGHWAPEMSLDSSFIPTTKLAAPAGGSGPLILLSQSGAFLLCRRSHQPGLRFELALSLGSQLDVGLADILHELIPAPTAGTVACYVEGFAPGQLGPFATAARTLIARGGRVLVHRAGRTAAGQTAAATHTGAIASDLALERNLLEHVGVRWCERIADFDAALAWLSAWPDYQPAPVAVVTNAGFESVSASDLFTLALPGAELAKADAAALRDLLAAHELDGLVNPRLPLDLTPMADEAAYLAIAAWLINRVPATLVLGLVPFSPRLDTTPQAVRMFADSLATLARRAGRPVAVVVDAGDDCAALRAEFARVRLPAFDRMESALGGLRLLA